MNARLYDPQVGRFLSPDNYSGSPENPQSYNRYSYVLNNPLKYTDPSGNSYRGPTGNTFSSIVENMSSPISSDYSLWSWDYDPLNSSTENVFCFMFDWIAIGGGGGIGSKYVTSTGSILGDILKSFEGDNAGLNFWLSLNETTRNTIINALNEYSEDVKQMMKEGKIYEVRGIVYQIEEKDGNGNTNLTEAVEMEKGEVQTAKDVFMKGDVVITNGTPWEKYTTFKKPEEGSSRGFLPIMHFHFHPPNFAVVRDKFERYKFTSVGNANMNYDQNNRRVFNNGASPSNIDVNNFNNRPEPRLIFCLPSGTKPVDIFWHWNYQGVYKKGKI